MRPLEITNQKNDILRLKGILDDKIYVGPRYLTLDITDICNINCIYCYKHSPLVKRSHFHQLPFELIKKVIKEAKKLGVEMISISGDGEPTLHPQIKEIIDYINACGIPYDINTNATCLEEKGLIPYLLTADFIEINLSAAEPKSYKLIHCPRNKENLFYKVIQNIKRLLLARGDKDKPAVRVLPLVTNRNISQILKIFELTQSLGIKKMVLTPMVRLAEELKPLELSNKDIENLKKVGEVLRRKDSDSCNLPYILSSLESKDSGYRLRRCYAGWFYGLLTVRGRLTFCADVYNEKKIVAGDIRKSSLRDIWWGEELHRIRLRYKYQKETRPECRYCELVQFNKETDDKVIKIKKSQGQ